MGRKKPSFGDLFGPSTLYKTVVKRGKMLREREAKRKRKVKNGRKEGKKMARYRCKSRKFPTQKCTYRCEVEVSFQPIGCLCSATWQKWEKVEEGKEGKRERNEDGT